MGGWFKSSIAHLLGSSSEGFLSFVYLLLHGYFDIMESIFLYSVSRSSGCRLLLTGNWFIRCYISWAFLVKSFLFCEVDFSQEEWISDGLLEFSSQILLLVFNHDVKSITWRRCASWPSSFRLDFLTRLICSVLYRLGFTRLVLMFLG